MKFRTLTYMIAMTLFAALIVPASLNAQIQPDHQGQTHYRVFSLGTPLGGSASGTAAINSLGCVAGDSNLTVDLDEHARFCGFTVIRLILARFSSHHHFFNSSFVTSSKSWLYPAYTNSETALPRYTDYGHA